MARRRNNSSYYSKRDYNEDGNKSYNYLKYKKYSSAGGSASYDTGEYEEDNQGNVQWTKPGKTSKTKAWQEAARDYRYSPEGDQSWQVYRAKLMADNPGAYEREQKRIEDRNKKISEANTRMWQDKTREYRYGQDGDQSWQVYRAKLISENPGSYEKEQARIDRQNADAQRQAKNRYDTYMRQFGDRNELQTEKQYNRQMEKQKKLQEAYAALGFEGYKKNAPENKSSAGYPITVKQYNANQRTVEKNQKDRLYDLTMNPLHISDQGLPNYIGQMEGKQKEAREQANTVKPGNAWGAIFDMMDGVYKRQLQGTVNSATSTEEEKSRALQTLGDLDSSTAERRKMIEDRAEDYYKNIYDYGSDWSDLTPEEQRVAMYNTIMGDYDEDVADLTPEEKDQLDAMIDGMLEKGQYDRYDLVANAYGSAAQKGKNVLGQRTQQNTLQSQAARLDYDGVYKPELIPEAEQITNDYQGISYYKPTGTKKEQIYFWMNNIPDENSSENARENVKKYYFANDEQRETFNKWFEFDLEHGTDAAMAYIDALEPYLNARMSEYMDYGIRKQAEDPIQGTAMRVFSPITSAAGGLMGTAGAGLALLGNEEAQDQNSQWYQMSNVTSTTREHQNEMLDQWAQKELGLPEGYARFAANVVDSMADNIFAMAAGNTLSGANVVRSEEAVNKAMTVVQWIMSGEATSNTMIRQMESGREPTEAALYAIGDGIIEWLTERVSLETLMRPEMTDILKDKKSLLAFLGKTTTAEGSEEINADLLNIGLDSVLSMIYGHENELTQRFNDLIVNGNMTAQEASRKVLLDKLGEIGLSGLAGALSGLGLGLSRVASTTFSNYGTGKNIQSVNSITEDSGMQQLLENAEQMGPDSESMKQATKIREMIEKKQQPGKIRTGRLASMVQVEGQQQLEQLEKQGEKKSERAEKLTDALIGTSNLMQGRTAEGIDVKTVGQQMATEDDLRNVEGERTGGQREVVVSDPENGRTQYGTLVDSKVEKTTDSKGRTKLNVTFTVEVDGKQRTVAASDIKTTKFATAALVRQQAINPGVYGENLFRAMLQQTEKGNVQNIGRYMSEAYKIVVAAETQQDMPQTKLDEQAAKDLYLAAQQDYVKRNNDFIKNNPANFKGKGQGTVTFGDGTVYGTSQFEQKIRNLDETQKTRVRWLAHWAKTYGVDLRFEDESTLRDSWNWRIHGSESSKGIRINLDSYDREIDAAEGKRKHHIVVTMGHEMTHWLQRNNMAGYNELKAFVMNSLQEEGVNVGARAMEIMDSRRRGGQEITLGEAIDEMVANACDQILGNPETVNYLKENNKGLFNKIKNFVRYLVNKFEQVAYGMQESASYESTMLMKYGNELSKLWLGKANEVLEGKVRQLEAQQTEKSISRQSMAELTESYEQAVKQNDVPLMEKIVKAYAKLKGYTEDVYHGTDTFGYTEFNMKRNSGRVFVAYSEKLARSYTRNGQVQAISERYMGDVETMTSEQLLEQARKMWTQTAWGDKIDSIELLDNGKYRLHYFDTETNKQTKWDVSRIEMEGRIRSMAQEAGQTEGVYHFYGKPGKQLVIDAEGAAANQIYVPEAGRKMNTHQLADWAKKQGYDSVRINNVMNPGVKNESLRGDPELASKDVGIYFNPADLKSADAIVYDDNGKVIPLSERFNAERTDIRWSMAEDLDAQYAEAEKNHDLKTMTRLLTEKMRQSSNRIVPYIAPQWYAGKAAEIAEGIKTGSREFIERAAQEMSQWVPDNAVLVPMPDHNGQVTDTTDTMILARAISERTGRPVIDALRGEQHESRRASKQPGYKGKAVTAETMGFRKIAQIPADAMPIFIDNVVGSGVTAQAAYDAMGGGITLAYAKSVRSKGIQGLKALQPTYYDAQKQQLIPLSQRMDYDVKDFKYSMADISREYDKAVKTNDEKLAQQLLERVGKAMGFDTDEYAYHGTSGFGFTEFDMDMSQDEIFVSFSEKLASTYTPQGEIRKIGKNYSKLGLETMSVDRLAKELVDYYRNMPGITAESIEKAEGYTKAEYAELVYDYIQGIEELAKGKSFENQLTSLLEKYYGMLERQDRYGAREIERRIKDRTGQYDFANQDEIKDRIRDLQAFMARALASGEDVVKLTKAGFDYYLSRGDIIRSLYNSNNDKEGIYKFYTRPGKQLIVDAEGSNWNRIPFDTGKKTGRVSMFEDFAEENEVPRSSTREIAKWAREHGYTSVRINDVYDNGGRRFGINKEEARGDIAIFFNEEDIKSADPFTYDDNGELIPIEERFSDDMKDFRWSMAELDDAYEQARQAKDETTMQKLVYEAGEKAGYTIKAYHGTQRADRVGTVFLPERATSGPMAYFTDDRGIAENYARDKRDTSLAYEEGYEDYHTQFRVKINGKDVQVGKLWSTLSFADRQKITERAKHITLDDEAEEIIYDENAQHGIGNFTDYERKLHGWNSIETLIDGWLDGGTLFGREEDFLKVLKMAGIEGVTYNDPDEKHEKVYDTLLKIQNPFVVSEMYTADFLEALEKWWMMQDKSLYEHESMSADLWDKNNISVDEWIRDGFSDVVDGRTSNWTRIPDGVTAYLKELGYDGIQDNGGKGGGKGHTVWIPFSSEQVKSADPVTYDDAGKPIPLSERFNEEKQDIRWSMADETADVNAWMMGLTPSSLQTEGERQLLQAYRDLKMKISVTEEKIDNYQKRIRTLEAKAQLTTEERDELTIARNNLQTNQDKLERLQVEMFRVTSSEGYAGMMYKMRRILKDNIEGKTQAQVEAAVDSMRNEAERVAKQIAQNEKKIAQMAEDTAIKTIRAELSRRGLRMTADTLRTQFNTSMSQAELEGRLAEIVLLELNGEDATQYIESLVNDVMYNQQNLLGNDIVDEALAAVRGMTIVIGPEMQKELKATHSSLKEIRAKTKGSGVKFVFGEYSTLDKNVGDVVKAIPELRDKLQKDKDALGAFVDYVADLLKEKQGNAADAGIDVDELTLFIRSMANVMLSEDAGGLSKSQLLDKIRKEQGAVGKALTAIKETRESAESMALTSKKAAGMASFMHRDVAAALDYYNQIAKQAALVEKQKVREGLIAQLKSENTRKLIEQAQKYKDLIAHDKKARQLREDNEHLRKMITTDVSRLRKRLTEETDQKNIQEECKPLARFVTRLLVDGDMSGMRRVLYASEKQVAELQKKLQKLDANAEPFNADRDLDWLVIHAPNEADSDYSAQDRVIQDLIDIETGLLEYRQAEGRGNITLQDRHNGLAKAQKALSEILDVIQARGKAFIEGQKWQVFELAEMMQADMAKSTFKGERTGKIGRTVDTFWRSVGYGNLTPEYFIKNLKNRTMTQLHRGFYEAEQRAGLEARKAKQRLAQIAAETGYGTWDGQEKHTIQDAGGRKIEITTEQLMALYATWIRENNAFRPEETSHLLHGGFVLAENDMDKGAYGRKKMEHRPIRMSKESLAAIGDQLTDAQKQYVHAIVEYMSGDLATLGNEASLRMFGIKKFTEQYYFPIKAWGGVLNKSSASGVNSNNDNRATRQSFSKRLTAFARNPIEISDFTPTATKHIVGMINYNTVGPAVENLNKVLNQQLEYGTKTEDEDNSYKRNIRAAFQEAYGKNAYDYLTQFMLDVNGGVTARQESSLREKLLSVFKKNAVAGSLSVAAQQPLSYIRAAMMINPKYLAQALSPAYWKGSYEEMLKHSGVAVIKDMGKFDMNYGRSMIDYITPEAMQTKLKKATSKISDAATSLPQKTDAMAWTRMWSAVKLEQAALHPEMDTKSEAFLDMVADRFNDLMRRTQVYDSVMVKSQNMRSNSYLKKVTTSFMAEPTLSLNVLADAWQNIHEKGGKANAAKALATFFLSAAAQAGAKALFGAGRSPNKKKNQEENFWYKFWYNLLSEANPLGLIPGYRQIVDVLTDGELDDDAMGMLGKAVDVFDLVFKLATTGKGSGNTYRDLEDTIGQMIQLGTSVPLKNFMRDFRAMVNWFSGGTMGELTGGSYAQRETSGAVMKYQLIDTIMSEDLLGMINTRLGEAGYKTNVDAYVQRIYEAQKAGNQQAADEMKEYMTLTQIKAQDPEKTLQQKLNKLTKDDKDLSAEEKAEQLSEGGYGAMTQFVTDQYAAGKIDRKQAEELYKKENPNATEKDILKALDKVDWIKAGHDGDGYTNYTPLMEGIANNSAEDINKAVKYMTAHGYEAKNIKSEVNKRIKEKYLKADAKEKIRLQDAMNKAYKALGYTTEDAEKTRSKWKENKK